MSAVSTITNGRLHYLVNNAGYGYMMPLLDADMHAVRANFEVNVFGLLAVTQAFFPLLRQSAGTVVNQCSIASLAGGRQPYIGCYGATKAAVASLNDTMRTEFAPFGVKVSGSLPYMYLQKLKHHLLCVKPSRLMAEILLPTGNQPSHRRCANRLLDAHARCYKRPVGPIALRSYSPSRREDAAWRDESTGPALPTAMGHRRGARSAQA